MDIKKEINDIYDYCIQLNKGKSVYEKLGINAKNNWVICSHGIGDVVWMCSYIEQWFEQKKIKKNNVIIVCHSNHVPMVKCYFPDLKIVGIEKDSLISLGFYCSSQFMRNNKVHVCIFPKLKIKRKQEKEFLDLSRFGLDMDVAYRDCCFDLKLGTLIKRPIISEETKKKADQLIQKNGMQKGKTVILVPGVNSRIQIGARVWNEIAEQFLQKGFDVYTNVAKKNDRVIRGTKRLMVSLEMMPYVVKSMGMVISSRCGLADWLFLNECNMVVLHSYTSGILKDEMIEGRARFGLREKFSLMSERTGNSMDVLEYRVDVKKFDKNLINKIVKEAQESIEKNFKTGEK